MRDPWNVAPDWAGETVFIVGGGVSAETQPTERLRGRKVIALNSSYLRVPFADVLLFGDSRWWRVHKDKPEFQAFAGRIVTCSPHVDEARIWRLRRRNPPGLAAERDLVVLRRTVMTAGINLAVHLGAAAIVTLGLDGRADPASGRAHHHEPHPWPQKPGCWAEQREDLASLVEPLAERGIGLRNASPGSALELWPVYQLEQCL
jgi:hypothetical protein